MNKYFFLLSVFILTVLTASATSINKTSALRKACAIAAIQGKSISAKAEPVFKAPLQSATVNNPAYYIFDFDDNKGFVIISGSDAVGSADGLLGYSDHGSFDASAIPDNFRAWLDVYAAEVEALEQGGKAYVPQQHAAIEPMLTSTWDQDTPYNNMMPTFQYNGDTYNYYTGCTITATAQVMRYHKWPKEACATIPAWDGTDALPPATFDWDVMKDSYGTTDQDTAVDEMAKLNLYLAQAAKAEYQKFVGTASYVDDMANALRNYFGYSKSLSSVSRMIYSIDGWDDMIYSELAAGRPVVYSGQSADGGHAFVCDGYRDGLYHINWGWSGWCDGYFVLSIMNPAGSGIGGSTTADGYTMWQNAIIGMRPPADGDVEMGEMLISSTMKVNASYVAFNFSNYNNREICFDIALELCSESGNRQTLKSYTGLQIPKMQGISEYGDFLSSHNLAAGKYTVYPVCRYTGTSQWRRCSHPSLYADVTVGADKSIKITSHPVIDLTLTEATLNGNLTATSEQIVNVKMRNNGDELYGYLYLYDTAPGSTEAQYVSVSALTVAGSEDGTVALTFTPETAGTHELLFYASDGSSIVYMGSTTVDIRTVPTTANSLKMEGTVTFDKDNPEICSLSVTNKGTDTYLRPLVARVFEYDIATRSYTWLNDFSIYKPIEPGETVPYTYVLEGMKSGSPYALEILYYKNFSDSSADELLKQIFFTYTSGIEQTMTDNDTDNKPYFSLDVLRVVKPLKKGIYLHNGK
ncbi:MAG: C10 family peptidase, partial [Prevotella sp.]